MSNSECMMVERTCPLEIGCEPGRLPVQPLLKSQINMYKIRATIMV